MTSDPEQCLEYIQYIICLKFRSRHFGKHKASVLLELTINSSYCNMEFCIAL